MIKLAIVGIILWALGRTKHPGGITKGGFLPGTPTGPGGLVPVGKTGPTGLAPSGTPIGGLISDVPAPGRLYWVRPGDVPFSLVGRAYGVPGGNQRVAALRAMTRNPWNRTLYGTPRGPSLPNTPAYAADEGIVITGAFLPRWSSPLSSPRRPVIHPETGAIVATGSRYGLLYFPSLDDPTAVPEPMLSILGRVS